MHPTLASLGIITIFISLMIPTQAAPLGSANSLDGLEERSVRRSPAPTATAPLPSSNTPLNADKSGLRFNSNLQLRVTPERDKNLSGIYPEDSTATGNKIQLLYQIDSPLEQK
jgi:hypothetical protein